LKLVGTRVADFMLILNKHYAVGSLVQISSIKV